MLQDWDGLEAEMTIAALFRTHRSRFRTDEDAEDAIVNALLSAWLQADDRLPKADRWYFIRALANQTLCYAAETLYRRFEFRMRIMFEDTEIESRSNTKVSYDSEFEQLSETVCSRLDVVELAVLNDLLGVAPAFDRAAFPYHRYRLSELPRQVLPLLQEWERRELFSRWSGGIVLETKAIWIKWRDSMRRLQDSRVRSRC